MNNVSSKFSSILTEFILSLYFIDDANWISDSIKHLEDILNTSIKFYNITRIAINKKKSKLFTNSITLFNFILIKFDKIIVNLISEKYSVCFLGININISNFYSFIKKDVKVLIKKFINLLKFKLLINL